MEIPNVRAHRIISDDFIIIFQFDKITLIYNYEIQQLFLFRFLVDIICKKKSRKWTRLYPRSTSDYIILRLICLMHWSLLEVLIPSETYHVQNIKSTNFILGTNTKSTNLYILIKPRKLIPMKYFHSI
jgi:hypothetical protein